MDKGGASIESAREIEYCECGRRRIEVCACRWQLVLGMDFTASNHRPGASNCSSECFHDLKKEAANPYLQALSVVAMLSICGSDGDRCQRPIFAYGFGDARTTSRAVFSFSEAEQALGPVDVAARYRSIVQSAQPGGPSSLGPLIRQTISKQRESSERHALLVLACGDLPWNAQQATRQAVAEASERGISIAVLGVGDGPFERMERLCRDNACVRFAKFRQIASHFPFGRLEAAQEIHRMLTAPIVPLGIGQTKVQASAPSSLQQPVPLCPPDTLLRDCGVVAVSERRVEQIRWWRVFKHVAAALSVSFLLGDYWSGIAGGSAGGSRKAMTFCLVSIAVCMLRKRLRLIETIR